MQTNTAAKRVEADIARLESGIRELKRQYDMFFAGARDREPVELRLELSRLIRHYERNPMRKYAHRFHFNGLVGRFHVLGELWGKSVRRAEQGEHRAAPASEERQRQDRLLARCRVEAHQEAREDDLRRLHRRYLDARRRETRDKDAPQPTYESFVRGLEPHVKRLRERTKCAEIELRLVQHDGKVQLKARPVR